MGFLNPFASTQYENPTQACASVKASVDVASIHPSEWVRRFLRMALKQPSKTVVVKAGKLRSAMRAMAFLCPEALPFLIEDPRYQENRPGQLAICCDVTASRLHVAV